MKIHNRLAIVLTLLLEACAINVEIKNPTDGARVGPGNFDLKAEIRSTGQCMGGERCDHVDWRILIDGTEVCTGTGTGGSGTYGWCGNRADSYCIYVWDGINTVDIGSGSHSMKITASASCHRNGDDSITINVP